MPATADGQPVRRPWPWWARTLAWLVAIVVVMGTGALVINQGTYASTEHTVASAIASEDVIELPASLTAQDSFPAESAISSGMILVADEHGVIARDITSGSEHWRYLRADRAVCAREVTTRNVYLVFANGDRCNEAIALNAATGKRVWQRTIETSGPNRIIWQPDTLISLDQTKVSTFDTHTGYERMKFSSDRSGDAAVTTVCHNLDVAGSHDITLLQRCRAKDNEIWTHQLVALAPADDQARELGRSYFELDEPQLLARLGNGTVLVRSGAMVFRIAQGSQVVNEVPGITAGEQSQFDVENGIEILTTGGTAYAIGVDAASISWQVPATAVSKIHRDEVYVLGPDGISRIDGRSGAIRQTVPLAQQDASPGIGVITAQAGSLMLSTAQQAVLFQ